jgi:hypothetical protein
MIVIAVLESGERIPLTDGWDEARRIFREEGYADVERIEQDDEGKEPTDE